MKEIIGREEENERKARENVDRYGHDAFFHYLVKKHDGIRLLLCQKMLPDKKIVSTTVENSELHGDYVDGKKYVLDILAKDDEGNFYNIEMQCYDIDKNEMIRFQLYGFRIVDHEARKGENYYEVKPIRQMIINTKTNY